jgi:pimeloyl-ACP methyl ester carboxylesterase
MTDPTRDSKRRRAKPVALLALAGACLLLLAVGCATAVRTRPADPKQVHRALTRSVLNGDRPSAPSEQALQRAGLYGKFQSDPDQVLAELHEQLVQTQNWDDLYALAELSFALAQQEQDAARFLTASAYAYAFLFPGGGALPFALDPRARVAAELYNRGMTQGFLGEDGHLHLGEGVVSLPIGQLTITTRPEDYTWGGYSVVAFSSLADVHVEGLRNRYRRRGIGAPLAAFVEPPQTARDSRRSHRRLPPDVTVPLTAFLRFESPRARILSGDLAARLELYTDEDGGKVRVDGSEIPLESESSSSLAFNLESARLGDGEFQGFFVGDIRLFGDLRDGLLMLSPHVPGRIPVVLVHGTASSPAWWGEMLNELSNDPELRDRYQFWLFRYNTGNPVLYSAMRLRQALVAAVKDFDPDGRDPALRRMVVAGHSQGGLLTKLTVVDSGSAFWDWVSDEPIDELDLDPEARETLEKALYVKPVPYVERVIFIATPHGGSFLVTQQLGGLVAGMIRLPATLATMPADIVNRNPGARIGREVRSSNSIQDMTPGDRFLEILASLPIAEGVTAHSIIAVSGDGPLEKGSDGVVRYESAHIEGVASEYIVRSGHTVQTHPLAIREVDRILRVHLEE